MDPNLTQPNSPTATDDGTKPNSPTESTPLVPPPKEMSLGEYLRTHMNRHGRRKFIAEKVAKMKKIKRRRKLRAAGMGKLARGKR